MSVDKQDLDTAYGRRENDPIVSGDKLFLGDKAGADWAEVVSYKWKGSRNPVEDEDYYRVTTMVRSGSNYCCGRRQLTKARGFAISRVSISASVVYGTLATC